MVAYVVPVSSAPNQTIRIKMTLNSIQHNFSLFIHWNEFAGAWFMDISDADTGQNMVCGIMLRTGLYPSADLLAQYEYMNIGSCVVIHSSGANPLNANNLGSEYQLVWGDQRVDD